MNDCIFCKIAAGEIPCTSVFEDERALAFRDINPQAPVHVLVIPRKHYKNLTALDASDHDLMRHLLHVANVVAIEEGIAMDGYRVAVNCGLQGGQVVQHVHFHVLGGRQLSGELG
ncbi:MAG: histidine triad nucleotide-binding protein [Dehalococcoidia bacterium]|nr:histidine triad nucleotide-binding protein [Dehalococcoidia bacterium]